MTRPLRWLRERLRQVWAWLEDGFKDLFWEDFE